MFVADRDSTKQELAKERDQVSSLMSCACYVFLWPFKLHLATYELWFGHV